MFLTTIQSTDTAPSSTHYILLIISQQLSSLKTEKEADDTASMPGKRVRGKRT